MTSLASLQQQWREQALKAVPPEYADRNLHHKYLKLDVEAAGIDACADDLTPFVEQERADLELICELFNYLRTGCSARFATRDQLYDACRARLGVTK